MLKYSLGIDVSKASFHACLSTIDAGQNVKVQRSGIFKNNDSGFKEFKAWTKKEHKETKVPMTVTMEATGVYYERLALYLHQADFAVSVILPNKAKKYIAALGLKTKNDSADARALSRMGAEQALDLWEPMNGFYYTLRALTRQYQNIQEMITIVNNQAEAMHSGMHQIAPVLKSNKLIAAELKKQLQLVLKAISAHVASDAVIAGKAKQLSSIKGVGTLTTAVIMAETNGFALFTSASQLVSYSGYDVVENQSGAHRGKTKISKKGNSRIRRALHMPALVTVTHKVPVFTSLYERVMTGTNIKMKGYVAVQKKLLTTMFALWSKNELFDPNYQQQSLDLQQQKEGRGIASDIEAEFSSRHSKSMKRPRKKLALT